MHRPWILTSLRTSTTRQRLQSAKRWQSDFAPTIHALARAALNALTSSRYASDRCTVLSGSNRPENDRHCFAAFASTLVKLSYIILIYYLTSHIATIHHELVPSIVIGYRGTACGSSRSVSKLALPNSNRGVSGQCLKFSAPPRARAPQSATCSHSTCS